MSEVNGNKNLNNSFVDVLSELKKNCMRNIHVAEIGIVQTIGDDVKCSLLNNSSMLLHCISLSNISIKKNDIVLIVFTDTDFRSNMKRINKNQEPLEVTESTHKQECGVIIGIIKESE